MIILNGYDMTEPNCDGCWDCDERIHFKKCALIDDNFDGSCPCTLCIIKMMCDIPCDKFDLWSGI